jgi:hypothetical protein
MKLSQLLWTITLATSAARAALPQPDLIAQIHFAGAEKFFAATNAAAFTNEFCSTEALALRSQTADKLARFLAGWLQTNGNVTVADGAEQLRPLFDDLQVSEWYLEARSAGNGKPETAIAIQLAADRAKLWQANLKPFFPAATFKTSGGWLVFDSGPGAPQLGDRLAQQISQADNAWLAVDVNWPRLAQWYPQLKELGLPETQFRVTATNADMHVDGKFFFPENLSLDLEPWHVPTNTVHQPFNSLTAVRGFSAWLKTQSWAKPYELTPTPNQFFVWAMSGSPYQTFAAIPVPDAVSALAQAHARLQPIFDEQNSSKGFITELMLAQTANTEISIQGTPFISPYLQAVREPAGQFLLAGGFPNTPGFKSLPKELFQRLAVTNLLLYHWEITAERLPRASNLSQLGLMLTMHRQLDDGAAALKWILSIAPPPGNTVTEIRQTAPDQLSFRRTAPGGLTAVEFLALAHWLEMPNFPHFKLIKLPPPTHPKRPRTPAQQPAMPAHP